MFASFNPGHLGITVTLEEGLDLASRHGFGGYDPALADVDERVRRLGADATRELFVARGLSVGNWGLPFVPYRVDAAEYAHALEALRPMIESAQSIGALRASMWIIPGSNDLPFDENFAFHVERFAPVAKLLASGGIRLGLEFVGPMTSAAGFRHGFVRDLAGIRKLCRAIGENVGILLDAWHWYTSGGTLADLDTLSNAELVHIHINDAPAGIERDAQIDNVRCLPGETGVIRIDAFMSALARAGYDGPVTAEPFSARLNALEPEDATRQCAAAVLPLVRSATNR